MTLTSFISPTSKGTGFQMLRVGQKRRRTHAEIEEERKAAREKQLLIEKKLAHYDSLKAERDHLAAQAKEHEGAALIV